jgi:parallel beta-helix repeat protein
LNDIIGNTVSGNTQHGIWLYTSHSNNIIDNTVSDHSEEVSYYRESGVYLEYSEGINVIGNTFDNNYIGIFHRECLNYKFKDNIFINSGLFSLGIVIMQATSSTRSNYNIKQFNNDPSYDNIIQGNIIKGYEFGIYIVGHSDVTITDNTISENTIGIYLDETSSNNNIYLNNFIDNENQAVDNGTNTWDNGAGLGNYWSDYTGEDSDYNGIGETVYEGLDEFPIMNPPVNVPPVADPGGPYTYFENEEITFDASNSADQNEDDELLYRWDFDNDGVWDTEYSTEPTAVHTYDDDYHDEAVVEVSDGELTDTASVSVNVNNAAPIVEEIVGPIDPVELNTQIQITGTFSDLGAQDTHTITVDWDDGDSTTIVVESGVYTITASHTYTQTGVFSVKVTAADDDGGSGSLKFRYVVIFDPSGGFVTGGGWIDSPEGAYPEDPTLTGKANFGFVAKHKKGTTKPIGNTEFQFHAADLNFHSNNYEWLVVAGAKAMFKGTGTINGAGEYNFMLTGIMEMISSE